MRRPLIECVGKEEDQHSEELSSSSDSADSVQGDCPTGAEPTSHGPEEGGHVEMDIALGVVSSQCYRVWHDDAKCMLAWQKRLQAFFSFLLFPFSPSHLVLICVCV